MATAPCKRERDCDTELRLGAGGSSDDAPSSSPRARESKKQAATSGAPYYDGGGDRLSQLQQLEAAVSSGRGDATATDAEAQASAIVRMARGAWPSDRGAAAARRRRSLRWFLQRRREARSTSGTAGAVAPSPPRRHLAAPD